MNRIERATAWSAVVCIALGLIVAACAGLQSMSWPVDCHTTTLQALDRRYTDELYDLHVSAVCAKGPDGKDDFTACPEYHSIWRRYWAARRQLDVCPPAGTVRS